MTSLVLGLALSTPAQPPAYQPFPQATLPPRVVRFPQMQPLRPFTPAAVPQPAGPVFQPPAPQFPAPGPVAPPVVTLDQFSRVFTPTPGEHHVWVVHPKTRQPVAVCFTLPARGKMTRFEVGRDWIEFEFDRPDVDIEINFRKNGRVEVEYDD